MSSSAHGDLDCGTVESLLTEAVHDVEVLRDEVTEVTRVDSARSAELDALRSSNNLMQALVNDLRKKVEGLQGENAALTSQVSIMFDELAAAERDTLPTGTVTFASVTTTHVVDMYRRISRVNRGPVPPSVHAAVEAAAATIREVMHEAGQVETEKVVRREVRRRRRLMPSRTRRMTGAPRPTVRTRKLPNS